MFYDISVQWARDSDRTEFLMRMPFAQFTKLFELHEDARTRITTELRLQRKSILHSNGRRAGIWGPLGHPFAVVITPEPRS